MQIHVRGFSVDNCCKSHSYSFLKLLNLLVVAIIFTDHVNFIHVSGAQNPVHRLNVNEFTVLSTSEFLSPWILSVSPTMCEVI